jgi:hypothetical protein
MRCCDKGERAGGGRAATLLGRDKPSRSHQTEPQRGGPCPARSGRADWRATLGHRSRLDYRASRSGVISNLHARRKLESPELGGTTLRYTPYRSGGCRFSAGREAETAPPWCRAATPGKQKSAPPSCCALGNWPYNRSNGCRLERAVPERRSFIGGEFGFDGGSRSRDACRAPLTRKSDGTSVKRGFSVRSRSLIRCDVRPDLAWWLGVERH